MSDTGRQALLERIRPDDDARWSIVREIAGWPEVRRSRVLRPHADAGFGPDELQEMEQRRRLDAALGALTFLEIACETSIIRGAEPQGSPLAAIEEFCGAGQFLNTLALLKDTLFHSQAFLHYVNAYLYFGIRFLAGRIAPPAWMRTAVFDKQLTRDSNARPFALVSPPPLPSTDLIENTLGDYLKLVQRSDPAMNPRSSNRQVRALNFLDDFAPGVSDEDAQHFSLQNENDDISRFALWLRGLRPGSREEDLYTICKDGLAEWALARSQFYVEMDSWLSPATPRDGGGEDRHRTAGRWIVTAPAIARFGLADMYWIARLFGADVSANAQVSYSGISWIRLLQFHAELVDDRKLHGELRHAEDVLRSVFDFVCDLVQNAAELSNDKERDVYDPSFTGRPPAVTAKWRTVFDEEQEEILRQRARRGFMLEKKGVPGDADGGGGGGERGPRRFLDGWMARVRTGKHAHHLVGLAFSGGGIRSATFNLGVLQGLQEFDLLRQLDYVSTVSGGGFIGSWLVANVKRTTRWLGQLMSWDESIAHLRRYSNYLAPQTGALSADTYTMWASWVRNAFLIQLTGLAWVFVLLLLALPAQGLFHVAGEWRMVWDEPESGVVAVCLLLCVLLTLLYNLWGDRAVSGKTSSVEVKWIRRLAVWLKQRKQPSMIPLPRFSAWVTLGKNAFSARWLGRLAALFRHRRHRVIAAILWEWARWTRQEHPAPTGLYLDFRTWLFIAPDAFRSVWVGRMAAWLRQGGKALRAKWVRRLAVVPAWVASFFLASLFWADATARSASSPFFANAKTYSSLLLCALTPWRPWLAIMWLSLASIAFFTLSHLRRQTLRSRGTWRTLKTLQRAWDAIWISTLCVAALYMQLCAIIYLFINWSAHQDRLGWYAFVYGPPLVLAANAISVVVFIGLCGRKSTEPIREWWTRYGTWLGIFGVGYLVLTAAAVFGPMWILHLTQTKKLHGAIKWGSVLTWIGTVTGGLFAGKSSRTSGIGEDSKSPLLEILAKVGGLAFIVGALLIAATVLYLALVNIGTDLTNVTDPSNYWKALPPRIPLPTVYWALLVAFLCGCLFSWAFEINIFGLNQFYRNRLVRCYLGASRWAPGVRKPQPFTKFDGEDDMRLSALSEDYRGPFPIFNCALNLGGSSDLALHTRHSASFSLTPLRCGADRPRIGYAPTNLGRREFAGGVMLGQAVAISGAAASPNMGYNTSPLVAFLLTMFNVRLGWWFPNPGRAAWKKPGLRFSLYYLVKELLGIADENSYFVNISDGGHFENLGIYELVRRRCKVIVASDAECDEKLQFGSLGKVVRLCETDFGAKIEIDVASIRPQPNGLSLAHGSVGKIKYSNGSIGYLVYLKASITGDEDVGVAQYRSVHPSFPHETTADQFFSEDQFESYRRLGRHVVRHCLRGTEPGAHPLDIAEKLCDVLVPAGSATDAFLKNTKTLTEIWERFRQNTDLQNFMRELMSDTDNAPAPPNQPTAMPPDAAIANAELLIGLELIQLMENVFLDLRLDDFWDHPDNRGWAILFMQWARSPRLREIWVNTRSTFGIRFEYFCEQHLGLPSNQPIVRVGMENL